MEEKEKQFNWKATIDENLRMGYIELIILHLLLEGDKYGYQLKQEIVERTNGIITFQESSLYIPLLRMTSRGLLTSRKEIVVGKRFRTYYHIEPLGKEYLAYGKEQSELVYKGINNLFSEESSKNEKLQ